VPNFIIDKRNLPLRLAATYHEVIGKAAYPTGIKQHNITRLLIGGSLHHLASHFYSFQKLASVD
jgi:hypothetical protein